MSEKKWKVEERRCSELVGGRRQRAGEQLTKGDVVHPLIYCEVKVRKNSSVVNLFKDVEEKAKREKKIPILSIFSERKRVWVMNPDDLVRISKIIAQLKDA